jgi:hypothetical protein
MRMSVYIGKILVDAEALNQAYQAGNRTSRRNVAQQERLDYKSSLEATCRCSLISTISTGIYISSIVRFGVLGKRETENATEITPDGR